MKREKNIMIMILAVVFMAASFSQGAYAVSSRDLSVDAALLGDGGNMGMLPPTGAQGALGVAASAGAQGLGAAQGSMKGQLSGLDNKSAEDKKGRIYEFKGKVRISRKEGEGWTQAKIGTMVREGDVVITSEGSSVSITFDDTFLNVTHIPENTRVVFRSIEPTDMFLEDGTIYNMFDGLKHGANWKVTTPTAVAAVRGTWWLVNYTSASGEFISATIQLPDDGVSSSVDVIDILENGSEGSTVNVPEGNQINLAANQEPDPSLLQKIDLEWLEKIQSSLEEVIAQRAENNDPLPPTGNDPLGGPGDNLPGGAPENNLDQQDTGSFVQENQQEVFEPLIEEIPNEDPGEGGDDDIRDEELCRFNPELC